MQHNQRGFSKSLLMTALVTGTVLWGSNSVLASETAPEFSLDPLVITAQKREKKDLETPAAVDVITTEDVEKNGGASAFEVLRHSLGLSATSMGPNGASWGTMTSEITIRGVERGTLILLDGVPLNQDGKYNLEDIPSDIIDRIEIVRGGGSVLYGSEASGGVINIITKKNVGNNIKVSAGNYGREQYSVSVGADGFDATAYYEDRGKVDRITTDAKSGMGKNKLNKHVEYNNGERKGIRWSYDLNDNLTFYHMYSQNENKMSHISNEGGYNNSIAQTNNYKDVDNNFTLNFDDKYGFKASASYGTQEKEYYKTAYNKNGSISSDGLNSWRKGHNTNIDINKSFNIGENKLLIGANYKKEDMDIYGNKIGVTSGNGRATYDRDTYSLYASYDWKMSNSDNLIVNMRETFAKNCGAQYSTFDSKQEDMSEFTPEVQYIKKLNENSSIYAKAGKSFRLPELTRVFGAGNIRPELDLYPEKGTHYEIGYKLNEGKAAWRLALFNYKIKDSITNVDGTSAAEGNLQYTNVNTKNTGIELSCDIEHNENLSSSFGIAWSNPEKARESDGAYEKYGSRLQLMASVDYHKDKFGASLLANYMGKRYDSDVDKYGGEKVKPALFTDFHISYKPEKNHKFFLHVNNIFDREDYTTDAGPRENRLAYMSMGRNFMLGYELSM